MKKFLTAACSVILLLLLLDTAYYRWGFYIDFRGGEEPSSFTAVRGKEILVDQGDGLLPYEIDVYKRQVCRGASGCTICIKHRPRAGR